MVVKRRRYKLLWLVLATLGLVFSLTACGSEATPPLSTEDWGPLGDVNVDGLVDSADLDIIAQSLGARSSDEDWNPAADLDINGKVDVADLAIAGRSYGSTRNFHFARPISNRDKGVNSLNIAIDASDRLHVVWSEGSSSSRGVYYTCLDRFGNTLVDDLLLDSSTGAGVDGVAVACDAAGNAHIVWDCHDGGDLCQARVDQWGYLLLGGEEDSVLDTHSTDGEPGIAVDSSGRAHVHYTLHGSGRGVYAAVTEDGSLAISSEGFPSPAWSWPAIVADADDNVHWLYQRDVPGPNPLVYGRYGYGDTPSLPERDITYLESTGWAGYYRWAMSVDGNDNAFIIWPDKRDGSWGLYLEKLALDGSSLIDDYLLWSGFHSSGASNADIALDSSGNIHVISPSSFKGTTRHLAYGIFDNDASVISPMRWVVYGKEPVTPRLAVDSHGDAHILYSGSNRPTCGANQLCYQSTAFDAAAYDRNRPDLGVDVPHLNWEPFISRWGQDLKVTGTVFNTGWAASPPTEARIRVMLSSDKLLAAPAQAEVDIPALNPGETSDFTVTLRLPQTPPSGFESLAYIKLLVEVDPDNSIAETTEANNKITLSLMVEPLPTTAGLFLIVRDDTDTARGREGVPLNTGTATISGGGIDRQVPVTEYITVLADDLPVGSASEPQTYTVSWSSSGYSTPDSASVTICRNARDPYIIDYDPENTVLLVTDRWGSLSGTIINSEGEPLSSATVRIEGQGISIETTTDADGNFSPDSEAELGQLIPGSYQIRVSKANYARVTGSVTIEALQEQKWNQAMDPTTKAYIHGWVINQYGSPVANVAVTVCGVTALTDARGVYDLGEVEASCTSLEVSCYGYAAESETIRLTAGLETIVYDIELQFDPPVSVARDSAGIASWAQDESSADLLPDPPDDAGWVEEQLFDLFGSKFWPSYRVLVLWGCYEYDLSASYSGPTSDRHLQQVQLRMTPRTFEVHMVSGSGSITVYGHSIKLNIAVLQDSGVLSAVRVIEACLVDADSGTVIKTVRNTIEGGTWWDALEEEVRTYDFSGVEIDNWRNAEVRVYFKVGKNEGGEWTSSPILRGWHFDQQVLRLNLSDPEDSFGDYILVDFPLP